MNRPTRVAKTSAAIIDHILTNSIIELSLRFKSPFSYTNVTAKLLLQYFLEKFVQIYDQTFPERKIEIKPKQFPGLLAV